MRGASRVAPRVDRATPPSAERPVARPAAGLSLLSSGLPGDTARLSGMKRPKILGDRLGGKVDTLLGRRKPVVGAERPADWYDEVFASSPKYQLPYQDSPYYFLWTVIADRLRRDGVKRVLEIGCGTGQLAAFLLDQTVETYAGIDFSAKAIEHARALVPSARFAVDDARTSNVYAAEPHEVLICTEVLEHITEDLDVVRRFRPGTRCLFSVPSYNSESHVRFFGDAAAVQDRYGRFFAALDIAEYRTFRKLGSGINTIFLVDARRNDVEPLP